MLYQKFFFSQQMGITDRWYNTLAYCWRFSHCAKEKLCKDAVSEDIDIEEAVLKGNSY